MWCLTGIYIQLPLEQHGLNCLSPLIKQFFSVVNTVVLFHAQSDEPADEESPIWRNCTFRGLIIRGLGQWGSLVPLTPTSSRVNCNVLMINFAQITSLYKWVSREVDSWSKEIIGNINRKKNPHLPPFVCWPGEPHLDICCVNKIFLPLHWCPYVS